MSVGLLKPMKDSRVKQSFKFPINCKYTLNFGSLLSLCLIVDPRCVGSLMYTSPASFSPVYHVF